MRRSSRERGFHVWRNILENSMVFLGSKAGRSLLAARSGPLRKLLLAAVEALPHLHPPEATSP